MQIFSFQVEMDLQQEVLCYRCYLTVLLKQFFIKLNRNEIVSLLTPYGILFLNDYINENTFLLQFLKNLCLGILFIHIIQLSLFSSEPKMSLFENS